MSTGRICPRCMQDVVIVCPCRTSIITFPSQGNPLPTQPQQINATLQHTSKEPAPPKTPAPAQLPSTTAMKRPREELPAVNSRSPAATFFLSLVAAPTPGTVQLSKIIGRSTAVEKPYVRPSSVPDPNHIRPELVLRKSFELCVQKPKSELSYISDQLKSIRQDLTVQQIDNCFTATVYEYHARVCLELSHLSEFGQCLNNVRALHTKGCSGDRTGLSKTIAEINPPLHRHLRSHHHHHHQAQHPHHHHHQVALVDDIACSSEIEFAAFRIAYTGLVAKFEDEVAMEISWLEKEYQSSAKERFCWNHPLVQFALKAVHCRHNAALYLSLKDAAPTHNFKSLLELFIPRLRVDWLKSIVNGIDDFVPASKLVELLGLGTTEGATALFSPILGRLWRDGFHAKQCREKVMTFVQEVTQQRVTA